MTQEQDMSERRGHCLCGAVSYQIIAEPVATRICWCRTCQQIAANGTVNTVVPTAALTIQGQTQQYVSTADSGNQVSRRFCPVCGCHLFANSSARPEFTVVRVGTLEDPSSVQPSMNIWTDSAPAWACFDPSIDRVGQQPVPPPAKAPTAN